MVSLKTFRADCCLGIQTDSKPFVSDEREQLAEVCKQRSQRGAVKARCAERCGCRVEAPTSRTERAREAVTADRLAAGARAL